MLRLFLFFLLHLAPPPTQPSSVAYFIYKNQFYPATLVTSGIIATEVYIITTKFPLSTIISNDICALPATDMEIIVETYAKYYCIDVKQIHYSSRDLALVEITKPFIFIYGINVAMIPSVKSIMSPLHLTGNCKMAYNERKSGAIEYVTSVQLEYAALKLGSGNGDTMEVALKRRKKFCVQDNGLPLYCEFAVIGILAFKREPEKSCCTNLCSTLTEVAVVKLFDEEVQDLLRRYITAAPRD